VTGDSFHAYFMSDYSVQQMILTNTAHCMVAAKIRKKLAVGKKTLHSYHMKWLNLKNLNEVKSRMQYCPGISYKFAAMDN
jgi:hypothetical protein